MIHDLKSWPTAFSAVLTYRKRFEVRKNDRPYAIGDFLLLREFVPETKSLTGRTVSVRVTYIEDLTPFGIAGFVGMGVRRD